MEAGRLFERICLQKWTRSILVDTLTSIQALLNFALFNSQVILVQAVVTHPSHLAVQPGKEQWEHKSLFS